MKSAKAIIFSENLFLLWCSLIKWMRNCYKHPTMKSVYLEKRIRWWFIQWQF